tara:strand:+ start:411 stop:854 length:444 start_codon:yes stop_codon:yes gene_type:complete
MSTNVTKSGRVTKKPERFSELSFLGGSGFVGCDTYDRNYDDGYTGYYYGREEYKDSLDKSQDERYENDLKNSMVVKEISTMLPSELSNIITNTAFSKSIYSDDINFIASDLITPGKQLIKDEDINYDWNTDDETSDEEEWYESDDEE